MSGGRVSKLLTNERLPWFFFSSTEWNSAQRPEAGEYFTRWQRQCEGRHWCINALNWVLRSTVYKCRPQGRVAYIVNYLSFAFHRLLILSGWLKTFTTCVLEKLDQVNSLVVVLQDLGLCFLWGRHAVAWRAPKNSDCTLCRGVTTWTSRTAVGLLRMSFRA